MTSGIRNALRTCAAMLSHTRFGGEPDDGAGADHAGGVNAVKPPGLERPVFQRPPIAGDLADAPGERERGDDRGDHRRPEHARAEHHPSGALAQDRRQGAADFAHAREATVAEPVANVAAAATSTAPVRHWVSIAPTPVSHRACRDRGRSLLSTVADCW